MKKKEGEEAKQQEKKEEKLPTTLDGYFIQSNANSK
jgi:hypothetical protein